MVYSGCLDHRYQHGFWGQHRPHKYFEETIQEMNHSSSSISCCSKSWWSCGCAVCLRVRPAQAPGPCTSPCPWCLKPLRYSGFTPPRWWGQAESGLRWWAQLPSGPTQQRYAPLFSEAIHPHLTPVFFFPIPWNHFFKCIFPQYLPFLIVQKILLALQAYPLPLISMEPCAPHSPSSLNLSGRHADFYQYC